MSQQRQQASKVCEQLAVVGNRSREILTGQDIGVLVGAGSGPGIMGVQTPRPKVDRQGCPQRRLVIRSGHLARFAPHRRVRAGHEYR
jgi:hypothetical protein